jgi:hypothetical protein
MVPHTAFSLEEESKSRLQMDLTARLWQFVIAMGDYLSKGSIKAEECLAPWLSNQACVCIAYSIGGVEP